MSKVSFEVSMSLDGFITAANVRETSRSSKGDPDQGSGQTVRNTR